MQSLATPMAGPAADESTPDVWGRFMACWHLCQTDAVRTLDAAGLGGVLAVADEVHAELALRRAPSNERLWGLAGSLGLVRPQLPSSLVDEHTQVRRLLLTQLLLNPWTLPSTHAATLRHLALCPPADPSAAAHASLASLAKFRSLQDPARRLASALHRLTAHTHTIRAGPLSPAFEPELLVSSLPASKVSAIQFGYQLHPDAICKRVAARHLLPHLRRCISDDRLPDRPLDQAAIASNVSAVLGRLEAAAAANTPMTVHGSAPSAASGSGLGHLVEIVCNVLLFPSTSIATGSLSRYAADGDNSAMDDTAGCTGVRFVQGRLADWVVSKNSSLDQTIDAWQLHPWLAARLALRFKNICTAYTDHLHSRLKRLVLASSTLEQPSSSSRISSSSNSPGPASESDWAASVTDIRTRLLLLWSLASPSDKRALADRFGAMNDHATQPGTHHAPTRTDLGSAHLWAALTGFMVPPDPLMNE